MVVLETKYINCEITYYFNRFGNTLRLPWPLRKLLYETEAFFVAYKSNIHLNERSKYSKLTLIKCSFECKGEKRMSDKGSCDIYCYNEEVVQRIQRQIEQEEISDIIQLFKVLADENRAKIAFALTKEELCVCDMANIIGSSVATASHHARMLKKTGVAKFRKEGKLAFYSLQDEKTKQFLMFIFNSKKKVKLNG